MRGEHCVAGASILTAIAVILMVFANIGQLTPGAVTNGIYWAELNIEAYGNGLQSATKKGVPGLYNTKNSPMGNSTGLRQYYRYGIYNGCGYQKGGSGICNETMFGYPMEPFAQMLSDTPKDFKKQTSDIIPDDAAAFKDNAWNHNSTRAGSLLTFVGSCLALIALITGFFRARLFFLIAAITSGLSALLLMIGAAIWTAVIAKSGWLKIVKVQGGNSLGIQINPGATLYLTWVSFALMTLAVVPYVVACCTYRSGK